MIKVEGHKHLYRDENTGAILNVDTSGYQKYVSMRNEKRKQKEDIDFLKKSTEDLKNEISEIKSLLIEIANRTQG
jgi:cell division protein FtsB